MKALKTLSGQQRIVVFFIVVILIPSLFLGLLAFRGIKSDHALVAQQRRQNIISTGKKIADACNSIIQSAEEGIQHWRIERRNANDKEGWYRDAGLGEYLIAHPYVYDAIFFDTLYAPRIHARPVVFVPDEFASTGKEQITEQDRHLIEDGWQYEFQSGDLRDADMYYAGIIPKLKTSDAICIVLLARARVQKKMKNPEQAIASFKRIRSSCPGTFINNQIPVLHTTSLELTQLFLESGDTVAAVHEIMDLYSLLTVNSGNIGQSAFQLIARKTGEISNIIRLSTTLKDHPSLRSIDSLESILYEKEAHAQHLYEMATEIIKDLMRAGQREVFLRKSVVMNDMWVGISISPASTDGYWALILNKEAILDDIVLPALAHDNPRSQWQWRILDEGGSVLRQSFDRPHDEDIVTTIINTGAFSWTLQSWLNPVSLFSVTDFDGRSIYILIFFIIVAILLFGLIFTYQAVNTEIRLARLKSGFISTVSHEFKSPLTSIRHMAEMLRESKVPSEERKREYYGIMLEQSQRLSHLIDNLLDFSKIEEGQKPFHFEPTEMTAFLREVAIRFQKQVYEGGFTMSIAVPENLPDRAIDQHAMTQVIHNLLDNAVKYSGNSRLIEFSATKEPKVLRISIRDYGLGIPKAEIPKIFDRFYRVGDALTGKIRGSGLGLTLVKQIVSAHSGTIQVDSAPGEGSTFHVILPVSNYEDQL